MRQRTTASNDQAPGSQVSIVGVGYRSTGTAFDNDWFALAEHEVAALDPRQRVTLELAVEALDDSGLGYLSPGSRAGVVFGTATTFGSTALNIAHQLSRTLDLHGPSLLVASDRTAPLVAVDTAVRLLADESVPFVIAGGADLTLLTEGTLPQGFSTIAIAETGHAAVLILQRTQDALRTGTRRYAEFSGAGMGFPHPDDTAAHITVHSPAEAPKSTAVQRAQPARATEPPLLIPLSARDLDALHELARRYAAEVASYPTLRDFAAAVARRTPDRIRAAILAHDVTDAATQLRLLATQLTAMAGTALATPHRGSNAATAARPGAASRPNDSAAATNSCGVAGEMVRHVMGSARSEGSGPDETGEVVGVTAETRTGGLLFLFSGGGGHARMGRGLAARYPVFATALAEATDAVVEAGGPRVWTPRNGFGPGEPGQEFAQPALFAFQVALAELLAWWGVRANAVAGHGVGELAAAVVGGAISLAVAARVVVARGRLLSKIGEDGAAAVLEATPTEVQRLIDPMRAAVGVAAVDGPTSITVSGDPRYIDALVRRAHRRAIFAQRITADSAAAGAITVPHAPRAQALAPQLVSELGNIPARRAELPIFSTTRRGAVIGEPHNDDRANLARPSSAAPGMERAEHSNIAVHSSDRPYANGVMSAGAEPRMDAAYWGANAAGPVELGAALERAVAAGISTVIEVGPHGVLTAAVREQVTFRESTYAVGSRVDEATSLLRALGLLHLEGRRIDWSALGALTVAPPERRWGRRVSMQGVGVAMPEVRIRAEGTYVVAGGLGDSGALVVRWLLEAGARDVVVLTRTPRALPEPLEGMEEWIVVVRSDAADRADLAAALQDIRECGSPIRGVVFAGRELHRVAATNLVELTAADPTDFTIGFSGVGWQPLSRVSEGGAPVTWE
ncbi:acyltransferase domain-containing protein [Nocardia sp. SYP-A9097]|uniref:acyltransferase domain-containing protein n=1 Tax=Nocardia sp. SYP-A9097 TaxID=2663237 RepID=UPI00129A9517|nr:acyltransferase domain-containing protein [Nocardia sp. SYP-A9097]MRH86408.1 acyltransferase domain-containing protein [Nocardia sp. SYP-A9097]